MKEVKTFTHLRGLAARKAAVAQRSEREPRFPRSEP